MLCDQKDLILNALIIYGEKNIDYVDAVNALILKERGIEELYSYDKHFDRIDWLKRQAP